MTSAPKSRASESAHGGVTSVAASDAADVKRPDAADLKWVTDLQTDQILVGRCQLGDERAFEELFLRYRDRLRRLCLQRLGDQSEAEDVVQEAFIRAWRGMPTFSGERRFYAWVSVIASNLCIDVQRKRGRRNFLAEQELDLIGPSVAAEQEALLEADVDRDILLRALGRLSDRHREVLELREGRKWSYQQIAAFSGVEVSAVETLLFRARRSLKREFKAIARAEGALGVLLVPWYKLRRTLARLSSGTHRRLHPSSGAGSSTESGVVAPSGMAGGESSIGTGAAPVSGLQALRTTWFSGLSGLSSAISPPVIGSTLAAAAATVAIAVGSFTGGQAASTVLGPSAAPASVPALQLSANTGLIAGAPVSVSRRDARRSAGTHPVASHSASGWIPSASSSVARAESGARFVALPQPPAGSPQPLQPLVHRAGSSASRAASGAAATLSGTAGKLGKLSRSGGQVTGTVGHLTGTLGKLAGAGTVGHLTGTLGKLSGAGTVGHLTGTLGKLSGAGTAGHLTGTLGKLSGSGTAGHLTGTLGKLSGPGTPGTLSGVASDVSRTTVRLPEAVDHLLRPACLQQPTGSGGRRGATRVRAPGSPPLTALSPSLAAPTGGKALDPKLPLIDPAGQIAKGIL